jgi:hypothetical protein
MGEIARHGQGVALTPYMEALRGFLDEGKMQEEAEETGGRQGPMPVGKERFQPESQDRMA